MMRKYCVINAKARTTVMLLVLLLGGQAAVCHAQEAASQGTGETSPLLLSPLPGNALKKVTPLPSDKSKSEVLAEVQNFLVAWSKIAKLPAKGQPPTDPGTEFNATLVMNSRGERIWRVVSSEHTFSLNSNTGQLITYRNDERILQQMRGAMDRTRIFVILNQTIARRFITRYASSCGVPSDTKIEKLIVAQDGDPAYTDGNRAGKVMAAFAPPSPNGYSFHERTVVTWRPQARFILDPLDGTLVEFSRLTRAEYITTEQKITAVEAVKLAKADLLQTSTGKPKLRYVVPFPDRVKQGNFYRDEQARKAWPPQVHLAWIVPFGPKAEVWIDAATGDQIGFVAFY